MRGVPNDMNSTCIQGGTPRPLGGHQPNKMMEPSSPASASQFRSVLPKQEPMDQEERNDSGINSGSDFHSSSPGSDHSENILSSPPRTIPEVSPGIYRLTPNMRFTSREFTTPTNEDVNSQTSSSSSSSDPIDAMKNLELTWLGNSFSSPVNQECTKSMGFGKAINEMEKHDEKNLQIPKLNSHGKVKSFKCKQCKFVAYVKEDLWIHAREHIPPEKRLPCTKCPFVTEYKHHLEYHLRNHAGSKPFKCTECNYTCVNKSMLNSHLKSHSNVHQYNCLNCGYNSKYCHSLKLHLRKHNHKPGLVLNPDGTPNPLPIIDVYGTRRGPKMKVQERKPVDESSPNSQLLPLLHRFMMNTPPHMQLPLPSPPFPGFPIFPGFPNIVPNPVLLQNLEKLAMETQQSTPQIESASQEDSEENSVADEEVLDLSKPEVSSRKNRRKGRAFKLAPAEENTTNDEETTIFPNVEVVENQDSISQQQNNDEMSYKNQDNYSCQFCKIDFGDAVLYTMHMGYHGFKNPFTCNMCGEECEDKVSFFLHIARTPHS